MGEIGRFLNLLFGGVENSELWFLTWSLRDKKSHWHQIGALGDVEPFVEQIAKASDTYCGVGLFDRAFGSYGRGETHDSAGIIGLWADVDFASDVHKKEGLPPTEEDARLLIADMGATPSVIINSGHGLQAWWLFVEPWIFESAEERQGAYALARRWNDTLRVRAATRGWVVDSTYDLARVMRIPGTMNFKGQPVPAFITDENAQRFERDDLEQYCIDDDAVRIIGYRRTYEVGQLRLTPDQEPPLQKLDALLENDTRFKEVWDGEHKELSSPSERDLSLASTAARAGWSDQEIADLLIYCRKRNKDDLKLRQSYYGPTIAKAHIEADRDVALDHMDETAAAIDEAVLNGSQSEQVQARRTAIESLSQTLGVEIVRIIKYLTEPAIWRLITPAGAITLGTAEYVLTARKMKTKLYEVSGVVLPNYSQNKWDRVAETVQRVVETEEVSTESTSSGQVIAWLNEYLTAKPPIGDREHAEIGEYPFREGNEVVIFSSSFKNWLKINQGERISNKDMGYMMNLFGAKSEQLHLKIGGNRTTRGAWRFTWITEE